jgi:hypothetical protein
VIEKIVIKKSSLHACVYNSHFLLLFRITEILFTFYLAMIQSIRVPFLFREMIQNGILVNCRTNLQNSDLFYVSQEDLK